MLCDASFVCHNLHCWTNTLQVIVTEHKNTSKITSFLYEIHCSWLRMSAVLLEWQWVEIWECMAIDLNGRYYVEGLGLGVVVKYTIVCMYVYNDIKWSGQIIFSRQSFLTFPKWINHIVICTYIIENLTSYRELENVIEDKD